MPASLTKLSACSTVSNPALRSGLCGNTSRTRIVCSRQQRPLSKSTFSLKANAGDSEASPEVSMSLEEAYQLLGVKETSTFDEILSAKNKKLAKADGKEATPEQVEAAYDLLFMQSMKRRLNNQTEVARSVRFADVPQRRKISQEKQKVITLPGSIQMSKPPNNVVAMQAAVFGGLVVWTMAQGVTEPLELSSTDAPAIQLALAVLISVYLLREKKRLDLLRSAGLTLGGLTFGSVIGTILQNWLRVDIVPLFGLSSPGFFVSEFAILGIWASCTFLG